MPDDSSTSRRVWTVSDPAIKPTPVNAKDRPKPANPPRPKTKTVSRDKQPGTEGLIEVYNPYSAQWKGSRRKWRGRRRKNAKRDKKIQQRIPKMRNAPVHPPVPVGGKLQIDPYYDSVAWRVLREATLQRDGHRCRYCGGVAHQADHVIPRSQKGPDALSNLVACCWVCNKTAGGRRFKNIEAKKRWILKNRDQTLVEPRTIPPKKPTCYAPKPKAPGRLRARLIAKHQSLSNQDT